MAYWLDEAWHRWPVIDEIGTAAAGLYARCGAYIADEETDGFIPAARARMYGTQEWIQRLVEVGLWSIEEKGFRDMRYLELNATKEQKAQRRKQGASRQAKYASKRQPRVTDASAGRQATRPPFPSPKGGKGALRALPSPHAFDDDGSDCCLRCSLPYANDVHAVSDAS